MLGLALGITAGLSPGPLMAFLISQTLKYGGREGLKISVVPLLTDAPVILASVFILDKLSGFRTVLGVISLAGAAYISFLAYKNITVDAGRVYRPDVPGSLKKGIVTNLLNPHPYLFWMTIGGPVIAGAGGVGRGMVFIAGFYIFLVGSKLVLTAVVCRTKKFIRGGIYTAAVRILGLMLLAFAFIFARDGLKMILKP